MNLIIKLVNDFKKEFIDFFLNLKITNFTNFSDLSDNRLEVISQRVFSVLPALEKL